MKGEIVFKKQHLLLGFLFLGMSIKPIYAGNFGNTAIAVTILVVVIPYAGKKIYESYESYSTNKKPKIQKNLSFALLCKVKLDQNGPVIRVKTTEKESNLKEKV